MTHDDVAKIDELEKKATPGPWEWIAASSEDKENNCLQSVPLGKMWNEFWGADGMGRGKNHDEAPPIPYVIRACGHEAYGVDAGDADKKLIAALRNAWPAISSALSAQGEMPEEPEKTHAGSFDAGVMVVMADDYDALRAHAQSLQAKINAAAQPSVVVSAETLGSTQPESVPAAPSTEALTRCEDCGGELVMTGRDRSGADYWCPTCSRKDAAPSDRKQEAGLVERVINFDSSNTQSVQIDLCALAARDEEIAGLREENERLAKMEQDRILMASEDEIRRELLNDGRDPEQYLRAVDTSMKCAGDNALLTHELAELRAKVEALEADQEPSTMGQALGAARDKD